MAAARAEQRPAAVARPAAASAGPARRPAESRESAPAEAARANGAGHAFGQVRLHAGPVPVVQARLTISQPGDPFEQEAERVADEVMRASAFPAAVEEQAERESVQTARDPSADDGPPVADEPRDGGEMVGVALTGAREVEEEEDERLPAPVELDAPAADESVQRAVRPDGKEEDEETEDEGEETVRRQSAASGDDPPAATMSGLSTGGLARELASARSGGGRPLPSAARGSMERAFGADFSAVRIHDDPTAHRLSRSVHALAFTNREHIFFAPGRFDTGSGEGRRLLAHELTHVVQQVPGVRGGGAEASSAPASSSPASASVQRAPAVDAGAALVAGDGEQVQRDPADGQPQYVMVARIYILDAGGNVILESGLLMPEHPGVQGVHSATISGPPGKRILSFAGVSITIFREAPGLGAALAKKGASISVTVYSTPPTGGGKTDADKDAQAGGGKPAKGSPDGKGTPGKPGSKYGWLGLLELDQETIDVLEDVFEALEDEEEYLALRETLEMLSQLGTHASAVEAWFSDTDKLLAIALGLEDNAAVSALEGWVSRAPTKRKLKASKPERKGIVAVAQKVAGIIEKVRRVLRPVFAIRASFVSLFGSVTALMEAMPVIQFLLDEEQRGKVDASKLLASFSADLASSLHKKMEELRKGFAVKVEAFDKSEFVTAEEIGRVVLSAGLKAVPGAGKLVVKIGTKIPGLEGLVADNLVAPLIPKAALDGLNQRLASLASLLEPAAKQAASDLDAVFAGMEQELADFIAKETGELSALFLSPGAGGGRQARSEARFRSMMSASAGEALPEGVRREMEGHLGFDFGRVRIHRDGAAGRAADAVNANAFALGSDLFFGPGRYDPASSAGRRLLAHELTHVAQQGGTGGQVIQRDYKSLRDKLIRKVGSSVKDAMKVAAGGSGARQTRAKDIRDNELEKLRGRKVVSETNPKLPECYHYVKTGTKITSIRRKLSWIRYVPSLTIDPGGRIKLGAEFNYDPKDADRAALRRACGCASGRQAHHVLPLEVRSDPIAKLAEANGFSYNGLANGVCLTDTVHYGSHPNYTKKVSGVLRALAVKHGVAAWTPALKADFYKEVGILHAYCKAKRGKLT